jgi:hypothetical protein
MRYIVSLLLLATQRLQTSALLHIHNRLQFIAMSNSHTFPAHKADKISDASPKNNGVKANIQENRDSKGRKHHQNHKNTAGDKKEHHEFAKPAIADDSEPQPFSEIASHVTTFEFSNLSISADSKRALADILKYR